MRLKYFKQKAGFDFFLSFESGETVEVNLQPLLGAYLPEEDLASAQIDPDWGCLEFRNGSVDIAPSTLYRFALSHRNSTNGNIDFGGHTEEPNLRLNRERAPQASSLSAASSKARAASG